MRAVLDHTPPYGVPSGQLTEVAYFDVFPANDDPLFEGTWSNYPFYDEGFVAVSGITASVPSQAMATARRCSAVAAVDLVGDVGPVQLPAQHVEAPVQRTEGRICAAMSPVDDWRCISWIATMSSGDPSGMSIIVHVRRKIGSGVPRKPGHLGERRVRSMRSGGRPGGMPPEA